MSFIISLKDIERFYDVGGEVVRALDGLDLNISANEYISIMGPSGSGKSTLMNMIGCLDTPTNGTYEFENEYVHEMNEGQLASIRNRKIGFVFQTFNLLPKSSALRNVEVPLIYANISKKERIDRAKQSLIDVGLEDRMHHKPNELSGGQRQRVGIARAIIKRPLLLLADEPVASLDPKAANLILSLLKKINKEFGTTILCNLHQVDLAKKYSDRLVGLLDGKIIFDEKSENINKSNLEKIYV